MVWCLFTLDSDELRTSHQKCHCVHCCVCTEPRMMSGSGPAPPGAVPSPDSHPAQDGSTRPPAHPASPLGSIPLEGPGTSQTGRTSVAPSDAVSGSLSSYNIVPVDPSADARVMSPSEQLQLARVPPPTGVHPLHDPNGTLLCVGYTGSRRGCNELMVDPAMCAASSCRGRICNPGIVALFLLR